MTKGKFHFKPLTCKFLFDKNKLKCIKPICKITVGSHSKCTSPARNIEEYISWNQELVLERTSESTMHIEILDQHQDGTLDLLGVGELFFDPTLGGTNFLSEWINLKDKLGHKVGSVLMEITYHPKQSSEKEKFEKLSANELHNNYLIKLSTTSARPLGEANDILDQMDEEPYNDEILRNKEDFITPSSE